MASVLLKEISSFKQLKKLLIMAIVKVIEVIASSEKGIDDAIRTAVTEVAKTVRNIDSVYVKDIKAHVKGDKVTSFGVICEISFRVD
jgi:flavin-binding protein dodecin